MTPIRLQRKRTKGFRLPPGTVCVTRPGPWGNPFQSAWQFKTVFEDMLFGSNVTLAVMRFLKNNHPDNSATLTFERAYAHIAMMFVNLHQLKGENVACFCSLEDECHGDTLLKHANSGFVFDLDRWGDGQRR